MTRVPSAFTLCLVALLGCAGAHAVPAIQVAGADYAFTSPDTVPEGEVAVSFTNKGTVFHEVKVIALHPGVTLAQVMPLVTADSDWTSFREPTSGILTAQPGKTTPGRLLVDFQPGRTYLLVCGFANSDTSQVHAQLGMIKALVIRPNRAT